MGKEEGEWGGEDASTHRLSLELDECDFDVSDPPPPPPLPVHEHEHYPSGGT